MPLLLTYLARANVELNQLADAWACISEATNMIETTKERWCEAEVDRIAGETALKLPERDDTKAETYFEGRARGCAPTAGKVLGTARGDEHGATLARSG